MNRDELFENYAWPPGRCLRTNFVYGLDASLAADGTSGHFSGPADNALLHHLRATADLVLVGASTAMAENYIGVRLPDDEAAARRRRGQGGPPPLAVLTSSGRIGSPDRFLRQTETGNYLVLTGDDPSARAAAEEALTRSAGTMTLLQAADLRGAIEQLYAAGHQRILCEGGPRVAAELAQAGLVDEMCVALSPATGGVGHPGTAPEAGHRYRPVFAGLVDDFVFTRWTAIKESTR